MVFWSIFNPDTIGRALSSVCTPLVDVWTDSEDNWEQELQLLPGAS